MTALQQGGVFVANIAAGSLSDSSGYDAMIWFFGLLSLAAFLAAALLTTRSRAFAPA